MCKKDKWIFVQIGYTFADKKLKMARKKHSQAKK